jgi:hypothetical protein
MIVRCPHCGTNVVPKADGACPSCQREFGEAIELPVPSGPKGGASRGLGDLAPAQGIGGWLRFAAIWLVVSPLTLLVGILESLAFLLSDDFQNLEAEFPSLLYAVLCEILFDLVLLGLGVAAAYHFFVKSRRAVHLVIGLLTTQVCLGFLAAIVIEALPRFPETALPYSFLYLIPGGIWIPYFLLSERVRNTFVH